MQDGRAYVCTYIRALIFWVRFHTRPGRTVGGCRLPEYAAFSLVDLQASVMQGKVVASLVTGSR